MQVVKKALVAGLVFASLLVSGTPALAVRTSEEDTVPAPGPYCIQPVTLPTLDNVIDAKWSPDGRTLAVVRFARIPDTGPGGYLEDEQLALVDMRTQKVRDLGSIEYGRPTWSPSGKYLAYWGHKADFLQVMDSASGSIVANLIPSNPEFHWQDDTLLYIQGATIRAWKNGDKTPETLGRLGDTKVPHYPSDNWQWSGDGTRFTLTRYDEKEAVPDRFIGTTATQDAEPLELPGALYTDWAPTGATLLVRYSARIDLRDFAASTITQIPIVGDAQYAWAPDGRKLLLRRATTSVAAGDVYEKSLVVWPSASAAPYVLPDVFGVRTFSPDGRYFGGTVRTGLLDNVFAAFRCYEIVRGDPAGVPVPFADRFAKIDAGPGRLLRPVAGPIAQFYNPGHFAVDVAAPFGSPIVASDAGVVTQAGWAFDNEGGYRVSIQHGGGLETRYYHASVVLVTVGQRVARGQAIALVGMSGITHGPHVHWEAWLNGKAVDPLQR